MSGLSEKRQPRGNAATHPHGVSFPQKLVAFLTPEALGDFATEIAEKKAALVEDVVRWNRYVDVISTYLLKEYVDA